MHRSDPSPRNRQMGASAAERGNGPEGGDRAEHDVEQAAPQWRTNQITVIEPPGPSYQGHTVAHGHRRSKGEEQPAEEVLSQEHPWDPQPARDMLENRV